MDRERWPTELNWRRLRDAARPVLDDPTLVPLLDRLAAVLTTRLDGLDQERSGLTDAEQRWRRYVLLTRIAMRYLTAATALPVQDRSSRAWPLLWLAAACRLRAGSAFDAR